MWEPMGPFTVGYIMCTGLFPRVLGLTSHRHLVPRLKEEYSYNFSPPLCVEGRLYVNLHFTFYDNSFRDEPS